MTGRVYLAINAIAEELSRSGIAKLQTNEQEHYQFRGLDDVCNALSPLLARHRLCVLPRVIERIAAERNDDQGNLLINVTVRVAFDLVCSEDGSSHRIESYGEALDRGDKATSKALSSAYKYALLQTFCIPVAGREDADRHSYALRPQVTGVEEPVQGWEQWSRDIIDMIEGCETPEAIGRVQDVYRSLLRALSSNRANLFEDVGDAIKAKRAALHESSPAGGQKMDRKRKPSPAGKASRVRAHA